MVRKVYNRVIFVHNGFCCSNKLDCILMDEKIVHESIDWNKIVFNIENYRDDLLLIPELLFEIVSINVNYSSHSYIQDVIVLIEKKSHRKLFSHTLNIIDFINLNSPEEEIREVLNKHMM